MFWDVNDVFTKDLRSSAVYTSGLAIFVVSTTWYTARIWACLYF